MMGLWADGWFYISSAGLLVSGILFFFLLGQYRVASEAADVTEGEQGAEKEAPVTAAIRPVYVPEDAPAAVVASHSDKPEVRPEPKPKPEETPVERRRDPATSTGGISPAVVYLQNIKVELADLHKDLRALSKRVDDELSSVSTRDEALIERLGELTRAVEGLKSSAAALAEPASEPEAAKPARKARKTEKLPEPEPAPAVEAPQPAAEVVLEAAPPAEEPAPAPAAEVKAAPAPSPDETIRMELGAIVAAPAVRTEAPAPAETAEPNPAPPPEEKPRRGPVWPV